MILQVKNLEKSFQTSFFSKKTVLKDVSFTLQKGSITGFLGANGSGKTTVFKCLLGLMSKDAGEVFFFENLPLSSDVLKRTGFLPEHTCFYNYLTGEELLIFYGRLSTHFKLAEIKSRARSLLKQLDIYSAKDQKISTYSKGMLKKIGIAQSLLHRPELLIWDEPFAGLDPDSRFFIGEFLQKEVQNGTTFLFSSHLLYDVEKLCQQVLVLKKGKLSYSGSVLNFLKKTQGESHKNKETIKV